MGKKKTIACDKCGHRMGHIPEKCPECGEVIRDRMEPHLRNKIKGMLTPRLPFNWEGLGKGIAIVLLLIITAFFLFALPSSPPSPTGVYKIMCVNQMSQIYKAMILYTNNHNGNFPWAGAGKRPCDHLQLLFDNGCILYPELMVVSDVHPGDVVAKPDANGKITLTGKNCSFTTYNMPVNILNATNIVILANKSISKSLDGYCRVKLDGSCKFIPGSKLPAGVIIPPKPPVSGDTIGRQ